MFGINRGQSYRSPERDMRDGQTIEERYADDLAVWQIQHGRDRRDFTPEMVERWRIYNRCLNAGLDFRIVAYLKWLVATGRRP
jgi:hypothetical protein